MSILRKVIIKSWLSYFFSSSFLLISVLSLGHILSALLRANVDYHAMLLGLSYEIPSFMVKIFPVSCLIASLFTLNRLKNRNELTAIFASGFSRRNLIFTLGVLGALVGILLFYINAYLVPYTKHRALVELNQHSDSSVVNNAITSGKIWFKGQNYFVSYANFDAKTNTITNLNLYFFDELYKLEEQISAPKAKFIQGKRWLLYPFIRYSHLNGKGFPEVQKGINIRWRIEESLQDFKKINADIATLSIWKLYDYIQILNNNKLNSNEYYVTFLDKFSSGITCLIFSMLSAMATFKPNRRGSSFGKSVALVLGFTFLYWFIYTYFMTLGQSSRISPLLATFGVPLLFGIYLIFYFFHNRKLR